MTTTVRVGMWKYAPFSGSISSSINVLNDFIKSKGWDAFYELVFLDPFSEKGFPKVDLIMLDGGEDINPEMYGERNLYSFFNNRRDEAETIILRTYQSTMRDNFRVSGSCRGHQLIAVFFGGSLYQDINKQVLEKQGITHPSPHKVSLVRTSGYYRSGSAELSKFITTDDPFYVSSLHHQAVRAIPKNFSMTMIWKFARGLGKLVEGIESKDGKCRGVQSHPEFKSFATDGHLFSYLMHADYFLAAFNDSGEPTVSPEELENVRLRKQLRSEREDGASSSRSEVQEEREVAGSVREFPQAQPIYDDMEES